MAYGCGGGGGGRRGAGEEEEEKDLKDQGAKSTLK